MNKNKLKIIVVGSGFGGTKTALELAKTPRCSVTLISKNTHFEYHGALHRTAIGHSPKEVVIPLREIFEGKNVDIVLDEISYIDPQKKIVVSEYGNIYPYDKVVFALGNRVNYFGIKSIQENAETMDNITNTLRLRKKLIDTFSQPVRQTVRIAVIGGGPSGIELASELPEFINLIAQRYGHAKPKVHIILIEGSPSLLPSLQQKASAKVLNRLTKLGVEVYLGISVKSYSKNILKLSAGEIKADILAWTAGSTPVDFYKANSSIFTLSPNGRVVVDSKLQAQAQQDIYVIGDNAQTPYSGMAQTALYDAMFLVRNFNRELKNKPTVNYRPRKPTYVIAVGSKWAVVQKGNRVITGVRGWRIRRQSDLWIFKNFEPYKQALKTWRAGNKKIRI